MACGRGRPQALSPRVGHANSLRLSNFFVLRAIRRFEAPLDADPRERFLRFRRSRDSRLTAAGSKPP